MFIYDAHVTKVYDGDTITADIDLGFKTIKKGVKFRLYGINTPEVRGPEKEQGYISRDWLREKILDKKVIIRSIKDKQGKYGRWLAEVYLEPISDKSLNQQMVDLGLAEKRVY